MLSDPRGHHRPGLTERLVGRASRVKRSASPPTAAPDIYLGDRITAAFRSAAPDAKQPSRTPALPESMRPCTASRTRRDGDQAHPRGSPPGLASAGDRTGDLVVTQLPGGAFTEPVQSHRRRPRRPQHGRQPVHHHRRVGRALRRMAPSPASQTAFRRHLGQPGQAENVDVAATSICCWAQPPRDNQGARWTKRSRLVSRHEPSERILSQVRADTQTHARRPQ